MTARIIQQQVPAAAISEGAGVIVHRTIGLSTLRHLDPFLMLDHFGSDKPDEYISGFPDHPHRGFVTLTYMLDGHMLHRDSMGNRGDLRAGGAQWMKAASGVIHSEMPQQLDGLMRGFQLWINLPAREKMSDPAYQEFPADAIPEVRTGDGNVRVLSGVCHGARGPIEDVNTEVLYLDVALPGQGAFSQSVDATMTAFVYVFEGRASLGGRIIEPHHLAVLGPGDRIDVLAEAQGTRFILVAGRAVGEPIVQHGPFVMSTRVEIEQAIRDYGDNRLVRKKADLVNR